MNSAILRADFNGIDTPKEMAGRPIDHRGFPVPWFVTEKTDEGHWDFVRIQGDRFKQASRLDVCWVTGVPLGRFRSFVVGPMCVINRVAGDPPVKKNIAEWSAQVCPFLTRPLAKRDRSLTAEDFHAQRGMMIERNPGVCAIYTVTERVMPRGALFHLPDPVSVEWWSKGRKATRAEVDEAIATGLPLLAIKAAEEGEHALAALSRMVARAEQYLPPEDAA